MKVIFLQDVPGVGKKYDVKEVANGLARNFLIPQNKAEIATKDALNRLEMMRAHAAQRHEEKAKSVRAAHEALAGKTITLSAAASEQGRLFAALTEKDIARAIQGQEKISIDPSSIVLETPIKEVGEYMVGIGEKDTKGAMRVIVKKKGAMRVSLLKKKINEDKNEDK